VLEEWTGKEDGKKQSKLVVVVDNFEFLEKREGGSGGGGAPRASASKASSGDEFEEVPF
jgi:single-stranded DNA-binding protein